MDTRIGYKIVRIISLVGFKSATNIGKEVDYFVGIPTDRPPFCGPLTVFDSLFAARQFYEESKKVDVPYTIFRCEYEESFDMSVWNGEIDGNHLYPRPLHCLPFGTLLANKITLLEEVPYVN